jgi:predicted DNA-binding transcriptional regulator YafY
VQDLCDAFQIKERTLFSDLRELKEELGVDIKFDRTRRGYYLASEQSDINFVTLTEESAVVLSAAFGLLSCYGGEELSTILKNQFDTEVEFCLPGRLPNSKAHRQIIKIDASRDFVDKDIFVRLCLACLRQEALRISVENKEAIVRPKYLLLKNEQWKLVFDDAELLLNTISEVFDESVPTGAVRGVAVRDIREIAEAP